MKNLYLISIIFLSILSIDIFSQQVQVWKEADLPPGFENIVYLDIQFSKTNPNLGWACGFESSVLRTTDSGETWIGTRLPFGLQLESIHFPTDQIGYLVGVADQGGIIWKSTDGGISWNRLALEAREFRVPLWGGYFYDENNGLVLGGTCEGTQIIGNLLISGEPTIYKTTDGGTSWSATRYNLENTKFSDPLMLDPNGECWAISSGLLWRSLNGGVDWEIVSNTGGNDWHEEITKVDNTFLIPYSVGCSGSNQLNTGGLRITTDGGASWNDYPTGVPMYGTFLTDAQTGWGVGFRGGAYYTSDGGRSWELRDNCLEGKDLDDIWVIDEENVWIAGDGLFYMDFIDSTSNERLEDEIVSCPGEEIILLADEGFENYEWSNGSRGRQITLNPTEDLQISVDMYNDVCLSGVNRINYTIDINEPIDYETFYDPVNSVCQGESRTLTVVGDFTQIEWYDEENNFLSSENTIIVEESGIYTVLAADNVGCNYEIPFEVEFNPNPEAEIIPLTDINVCIGETIKLDGGDHQEYFWYKEPGELYSNDRTIDIVESGTFSLEVINEFGCRDISDKIELVVRPDTNYYDFNINYSGEPADFGFNDFGNTRCVVVEIENTSDWRIASLDNPYLINNKYFSVPSTQLPISIDPGEKAELIICFKADSLGLNLDSLLIPDLCSDHILPMKAVTNAIDYETNTRCRLNISIHQLDAGIDFYSTYSDPYPNPASNEFRLDFIHYTPNDLVPQFNLQLININGEFVINGVRNVENIQTTRNGIIESGNIFFDLTDVPSGVYIVNIQDPDKSFTRNLVVID